VYLIISARDLIQITQTYALFLAVYGPLINSITLLSTPCKYGSGKSANPN
jgi:hypothetical protein